MRLRRDPHQLEVYLEGRKRRMFVGLLTYRKERDQFHFSYDSKYMTSPRAIPLGPDLSLFKKNHISEKKLFPSFSDRIPSRENPAYEDDCKSQGISVNEKNPIVLLGTIGHRGPSSLIFEPVLENEFSFSDILRFRKTTKITRNEMALAFDFNELTLHRIEKSKSFDLNTLRRLQIYLEFPEVGLWQLSLTGRKINTESLARIHKYYENMKKDES